MNVTPAGGELPRRRLRPTAVPPPGGIAPAGEGLDPDLGDATPEGEPPAPAATRPPELAEPFGQSEEDRALIQQLLERWYYNPVQFAWDVFRVHLWRRQRQILYAAARESAQGRAFRIAVRSGHKCGKSMVVAILALWWATTRRRARVVMTAPSARQIRSILWREIQMLYRAMRDYITNIILYDTGHLPNLPGQPVLMT